MEGREKRPERGAQGQALPFTESKRGSPEKTSVGCELSRFYEAEFDVHKSRLLQRKEQIQAHDRLVGHYLSCKQPKVVKIAGSKVKFLHQEIQHYKINLSLEKLRQKIEANSPQVSQIVAESSKQRNPLPDVDADCLETLAGPPRKISYYTNTLKNDYYDIKTNSIVEKFHTSPKVRKRKL